MSFWDDIAGLFTGDTYFPDNPNREARAKELARDCQNYAANLATLMANIKNELKLLDQQLAAMYGNPADIPPDAQITSVTFNGVEFEVSQLVASLVMAPVVSSALTVGATSYLVSTGEIGAAALVDLVGLPAAFDIAIGAAAGVAAIGISFAIGAIEGAVKRDKLQDTIHKGIAGRTQLAKAFLVNSQLESSIHAMIAAITALQAAGVPIPQIMQNLQMMVASARAHLDTINDASALAMLAQIDGARGSWTNEDA